MAPEAPTDSGSASATHGKSLQAYSSTGNELEVISEVTRYTHEDSVSVRPQSPVDKQNVQNLGLYTADTTYSASETSTLPPPRNTGYITDLATELFHAVKPYESHRKTFERISDMLPDLLRSFALKLGHKAQSQLHRDVSFFVHKYRRNFALGRYLGDLDFDMGQQTIALIEDNGYHDDELIPPTPKSYEDLLSDLTSPESDENDDAQEDDMKPTPPDAGMYRDFIVKTPAYSWLVASLQREATLTRATPDIMEELGQKILGSLPSSRKVSRKAPSQQYKAIFELNWDPLLFIKEQEYTESPDEALERAITITGSTNDAQAVTTGEYLSQTWPATGKDVMRLVTDVVRNTKDHHVACNLPDGTELDAHIDGGKFILTAVGPGDSLAEIGQQFAWLGAALRSSPFEAGVVTCSPFVQSTRLDNILSPAEASEPRPLVEIFCVIDFNMYQLPPNDEGLPGQCWYNMFKNPVMVIGYPILTKHDRGLGLEIPLNMVAALAGSNRANEFDGKIFIKGFSTMLIATKITRDLLIWHYFYNRQGERISYLDHELQNVDSISLLQLDSARHVVGWCSKFTSYAGESNARYNIDGTGLPPPHAGCLLEKVSLSGGKIITGGMTFAVAVKDVPPHLTRHGYIPKLKWIATKYIVLWDEKDKRGWLANGTSALLHLVRTSLDHYSKDDFSDSFLFDPSRMKDPSEHKPNSASRILSNLNNRELVIYPGRSERGYYLFEDLVEQHYSILEQIMDHHRNVAGQNGVNLKLRVRKHLEGWDFVELATDHDPCPRVATLQALGYGWVDFIRSIGAITLFGCGFGDIIRPIAFDGMCPGWKTLPTQKYYLAASVFDLNNIMTKFGKGQADPLQPVHGLLWHCPGDVVAPCQCQAHGARQTIRGVFRRHHDPVQVFHPKKSGLVLHIRRPQELDDGGAVVFGHNFAWRYRWKEGGEEDVEAGHPPSSSWVPEYGTMADSGGSGSESSSQRLSLSNASRSSQSRSSTARLMTDSSISTSLTSTPAESGFEPDQALTPIEPKPAYDQAPSQQVIPDKNRPRTLRHERRRL
ncbi:hypothetical protein B0T10DRAFT_418901 [Thelonectria olida]|uniref:Uncharacterized protein n=1 Tax=Thelonectria olida TaxID=1576542 RepID=A0A9P9AGS5_9HYPO|nr:hypothetical protein B0T10DRAFT_418901 [Thelonectria olida]